MPSRITESKSRHQADHHSFLTCGSSARMRSRVCVVECHLASLCSSLSVSKVVRFSPLAAAKRMSQGRLQALANTMRSGGTPKPRTVSASHSDAQSNPACTCHGELAINIGFAACLQPLRPHLCMIHAQGSMPHFVCNNVQDNQGIPGNALESCVQQSVNIYGKYHTVPHASLKVLCPC